MQTININGTARRQLKFELEKDDKYHRYKGRTDKNREDAKKYMSSSHEYELYISHKPTGIKRTMLGREANLANKLSIQKYISNKVKGISAWVLVNKILVRKEIKNP